MDLLIALALARGFENAAANARSGRHPSLPVARGRRTLHLRSVASAVRRERAKPGEPARVTS